MSKETYPLMQPHTDSLEQNLYLRLKEINSFNNSIQNMEDIKTFLSP